MTTTKKISVDKQIKLPLMHPNRRQPIPISTYQQHIERNLVPKLYTESILLHTQNDESIAFYQNSLSSGSASKIGIIIEKKRQNTHDHRIPSQKIILD
jgi:hypothetical protein